MPNQLIGGVVPPHILFPEAKMAKISLKFLQTNRQKKELYFSIYHVRNLQEIWIYKKLYNNLTSYSNGIFKPKAYTRNIRDTEQSILATSLCYHPNSNFNNQFSSCTHCTYPSKSQQGQSQFFLVPLPQSSAQTL